METVRMCRLVGGCSDSQTALQLFYNKNFIRIFGTTKKIHSPPRIKTNKLHQGHPLRGSSLTERGLTTTLKLYSNREGA